MKEIQDAKLLARVKNLIQAEHAGYIREGNKCVEPGCSCNAGLGENDPDPVSGPFRDPPVRCSSFEKLVLPLDPDLEAAYNAHVNRGVGYTVRRCQRKGCRREIPPREKRGRPVKFCEKHALLSKRQSNREYARQRREKAQNGGNGSEPAEATQTRPEVGNIPL